MASKEFKINKQAAAGTTRNIILTIPERLEKSRKPGSATSYKVIMRANTIRLLTAYGIKKQRKKSSGLLTTYGMKKNKEKIKCKNSVW